MRFFITRHGKVESNDREVYNGVREEPLTKEGKKQAEKLANRLKEEKIQKIISSESQRAIETARVLNTELNLDLTYQSCLREINFGIFENKTFDYIKTQYPEIYKARKKDKFKYRIPGGESYEDIYNRVSPLIYELAKNKDNVLLVTHATVIKVLLYLLTRKTLPEIEKQIYKNTCLFEFELNLKHENLQARSIIYNCTKHLPD